MKIKKRKILFLSVILLFGFALRLYFAASLKSIWLDEATWIKTSGNGFLNLMSGNYRDFTVHPFIPYLVIKIFHLFGADESGLRIPFLLFSLLSVILVYLISKELFGKERIALTAMLLFSFSAYNIRFSPEIKYLSLLLLFELISLTYYLKIINGIKKRSIIRKNYFLFVIFSTLSFLTDYSFVWLYAVFWLFLIYLLFKNRKSTTDLSFRNYPPLILSLISVPLMLTYWIFRFVFSLNTDFPTIDYIVKPKIYDIIEALLAFLTYFDHNYAVGVSRSEDWYQLLSLFVSNLKSAGKIYYWSHYLFLGLFILLLIINRKKLLKDKLPLVLTVTVFPLASSFVTSIYLVPIFIHYNIMIVQSGLVILMACSVFGKRVIGASALIAYLVLNTSGYYFLLKSGTFQNYKEIIQFIDFQNRDNGSLILVIPDYHMNALEYYEKGRINSQIVMALDSNEDFDDQYISEIKNNILGKNQVCFVVDPGYIDTRITRTVSEFLEKNFSQIKEPKEFTGFSVKCFSSNKLNENKL